MQLALRTSAADGNSAGASPFIAIAVPAGVVDGDLVLVGLTIPTGTTATPPDGDWSLITSSDPANTVYVVVYAKLALNEQARWVFALSGSVQASGVAAVYTGQDVFGPIDAAAAAGTSSSASHNVAGITAADDGEELVVFLGAATSGTYTPASGWLAITAKQQANATMAVERHLAGAAGARTAFTVGFSASADGASVVLALRPSPGTLSLDDVRARVVGALPPGVENVYNLEPGGDYYKFYTVEAMALKASGYDLVDLAELEVIPERSRYKLPDWERLFGVQTSLTAKQGTYPARRAQVLSRFREMATASSSIPAIQAAASAILGYTPQVLEVSRSALTPLHTWSWNGNVPFAGGATLSEQVNAIDEPTVSVAGAQLAVRITHPSVEDVQITLTAPDATAYTFAAGALGKGAVVNQTRVVAAPGLAGAACLGLWTITVHDAGAAGGTLFELDLFVEAVGHDALGADGLGSQVYRWAIFWDSTKVQPGARVEDLYALVRRMNQVHCVGTIVFDSLVSPGVLGGYPGDPFCIPDRFVPVA